MGLPESTEGPHPTAFFSQLLVEVFGHKILPLPPELNRVHRIPTPKPASEQRPRPVILQFHRYQVKDLVICESQKNGALTYQGNTIQIFEDYSLDVLKLRGELKDAMAGTLQTQTQTCSPLPSQITHQHVLTVRKCGCYLPLKPTTSFRV